MTAIRCIRVDPPAKPSREEVIMRWLREPLSTDVHEVAASLDRRLVAWEADTPAPTYRIELDAETFEALTQTNIREGKFRHAQEDLYEAMRACAYGPNDGDLANAVMADAYADPEQRAWIEAQQAEALTNPGPPDDMEAIRALIAEQDDEGLAEVDVPMARTRTIAWGGPVPEVVTLCGSTRFMEHFVAENRRLSLAGCIVISLGLFGHREGLDIGTADEPSPVKVMLDELHKRKIDLADRVHVINVGGYIGSSTRSEIDYAEAHGIPVTYMENERGVGTAGATDSSGETESEEALYCPATREDCLEGCVVGAGCPKDHFQRCADSSGSAEHRYADIGDRTKDGVVIRFEPGFGLNVYIEVVKHQGDRSEVYKSVGLSDTGWEKVCDAVDEWRRRNDNAPNRCPGYTVTAEELAEAWWNGYASHGGGVKDYATLSRDTKGALILVAHGLLARFFPEHIAKPAEPVAVERCGRNFGSWECRQPKGHGVTFGIGCSKRWRPEDGPEPTEPVVYGGDGTVPHG